MVATEDGPGGPDGGGERKRKNPVTLKDVAEHVGVSPTTVSLVLNGAPGADSIPEETKDRVRAAARELEYRPNQLARSLRRRRTFSVGVMLPEIIDGYATVVMSGVEQRLVDEGYFYFVASHRWKDDLRDEYVEMLKDRRVEGFILINTPMEKPPGLPAVSVSGHRPLDGVTNVELDHDVAAELALGHLAELGHERIAFFKGHPHTADTEPRWQGILRAAEQTGLEVRPELTVQLSADPAESFTSEEGFEEGYAFGRKLLDRDGDFTALFAFNDVSAIGAMRAFLDAGLRVPGDVSVVGFDDITSAAFHNPSLTTVRQPLREMGEIAGDLLLDRLTREKPLPASIDVEPDLVVRDSTGPAPRRPAPSHSGTKATAPPTG